MKLKRVHLKGALLSIFLPLFLFAQEVSEIKEVEGSGKAEILKGDVSSAEKAAVEDALRNAVEKVGVEVVSETIVENFELVKDRIMMRASGYVHGYEVIDKKVDGGFVRIQLKAKVSGREIKDDASFIYQEMDKPRILILVNEVGESGIIPSKFVENIITEYFLSKNFKVLDSNLVREKITRDEINLAAEGDANAARKLGARAGAEVIITGTATKGKPESVRDILYASKSSVSLRSIRGDTGELYATSTESLNGIDATPNGAVEKSMKESAMKSAREIFWKTVKKWNDEKLRGKNFELIITGIDFSLLPEIKNFLMNIKGMREVHQRDFAKPNVIYDVVFEGSAERLAQEITSRGKFRFEVLSTSANKIHLKKK